jgi:hypothetical protein
MALSNINRVACACWDIGTNKAVIAARSLYEIDPFLDVRVVPDGLTGDNCDELLRGLDLVIEECDDLYTKLRVRELARELRIPVLMETNDRGLVDVERFDLEPERPIFHGLLGSTTAESLLGLDMQQKVRFILALLGAESISPRLASSMMEIDRTLTAWPQLGSGTMLGGAVIAEVARRTLLGELTASGRFNVDLELLAAPASPVSRCAASTYSTDGVAL